MTAQIGEKLHYKGHVVSMCSQPLGDYFELAGIEPGLEVSCTALWRGYVGTWEILDKRLYLIGLSGTLLDGAEANVATFFPDFRDRVFAHWYSGELRVPQGKLLNYVHQGYNSTYESDLIIAVDKGIIVRTKVRRNGTSTDPTRTKKGYGIGGLTVFPRSKPDTQDKS